MECLRTKYIAKHDINVPCGNCGFCMATRRSDWSSRLHYDRRLHSHSSFVTLTYADPHLKFKSGKSQLVKEDLQKWFKRVRKAGYKFRYYAVGEYGSRTYRPHYHILVFGDVPEAVVRKSWSFGQVHIGRVTPASTSYCLKYMVNAKVKSMRNGRALPFAVMSRRPGLGANYLTKSMVEWHRGPNFSEFKNYMLVDGKKVHLPRYYKGKIFSKLDNVRMAIRDTRHSIELLRKRFRKLKRHRDPIAYIELQRRIAEKRIRVHCRKNLTI